MSRPPNPVYEFGPFRFNPADHLLTRDGVPVPLPPRVLDTLLCLIQGSGRLLTKNEIIEAAWPNAFVEESNLMVAISVLRKALGDEGATRKYIQTVPRAGYRFIAEVRETTLPGSEVVSIPVPPPSVKLRPTLVRNWWIAAALIVLAAVGAWAFARRGAQTPGIIRTVAVLPFHLLSADSGHEYLGVGLTDALITKLGVANSIVVRPTSAVLKYSGENQDPLAAGREQGVDAIIEGRIQASSQVVRVTVQLIRVSDGVSAWSGTFEESAQKLFRLEDTMGETIAANLTRHLTGGEKLRIAHQDTASNAAYEYYMRGRYLWNRRTEESLRRAIEYFKKALAQDPEYALAYAGLADSYALMASFSAEPGSRAHPDARAAALKAIQLDAGFADPYASLGMISFFSDWEWTDAERHFQKAIALQPEYATAHHWYGLDLAAMGRLPDALQEVRRAERLDPQSLIIDTNVGWILYFARRYDEAIAQYRRVLELDSGFARARTRLGIAYAQKNELQPAIRELEQALTLSGQDPYITGVLGYARARAGDRQFGYRTLKDLEARSKDHYVPPFALALVCIGLGDRDTAFHWLERAYDDHSTSMVYIKVDPILDPLRGDPRFQMLLKQMKF